MGGAAALVRDERRVEGSEREFVSVAEGYERWAPTYDDDPNPLLALEERELKALLPDLRGKVALDLACGTGRWLRILSQRATALVVGVDSSAGMLRVAAEKDGLQRSLVRANCSHLPLANAAFDFAMCSFAIRHISDLGGFARECARVLKPGAVLFVSDLHPDAYAAGWRTGFRDRQGPAEIESIARTSAEIVGEFRTAGFEHIGSAEFCFGENERRIFARAGKENFFEVACRTKAILLLRFARRT